MTLPDGLADGAIDQQRPKKQWSDLSPPAQAAIVVGGVAELVVTSLALRDLRRRPRQGVRGPKFLWLVSFVVQPFGPLTYFWLGRRREQS